MSALELQKTLLECEARSVMKMKTITSQEHYLECVDEKRGKASGDLLRNEIKKQWDAK